MNLGCGERKLADWTNVDAQPLVRPDVVADLAKPWPWENNSIDEVNASHLLEHIAPGAPFFHFMRELYRVCKPGAKIEITLPHPSHDIFHSDPTHLHAILPGTFAMLSKCYVEQAAERGDILTPFYAHLGVDFDIKTVRYTFDPSVDKDAPDLQWQCKHLRNIISQWATTLTVVK